MTLRVKFMLVVIVILTAYRAVADPAPQTTKTPLSLGYLASSSWWLQRAVKEVSVIADPDCRDEVYGHLGRAQARSDNIDEANISAAAISNPLKSVYIHTFVAKLCYESGNELGYRSSMKQAKTVAIAENRVESQIFINSNMIRTYLDSQDVDGAKSFAEALQSQRSRQSAYQKIAVYLSHTGNIKEANAILDDNIPPYWKQVTLLQMAEACVRKEKMSEAEAIAKRITKPKYRNRVYARIGVALAGAGNLDKARVTAGLISGHKHKSAVLASIAKAQIKSGSIDAGKKTARNIAHRDYKVSVYTTIAKTQVEVGQVDAAKMTIEAILKMIETSPLPADQSKFGTFDDSYKEGTARLLYLTIAKALAKQGDNSGYRKYIAQAKAGVGDMKVDPALWQGVAFVQIVSAQLEAGDIEGAKNTAKAIEDEHNRSWALYNVAKKQLDAGDIGAAVCISKAITDTLNKSFAYAAAASALVRSGKVAEAKAILATLGDSEQEARAYRSVAKAFVETDRKSELMDWLKDLPSPEAMVYACLGAADGVNAAAKAKLQ